MEREWDQDRNRQRDEGQVEACRENYDSKCNIAHPQRSVFMRRSRRVRVRMTTDRIVTLLRETLRRNIMKWLKRLFKRGPIISADDQRKSFNDKLHRSPLQLDVTTTTSKSDDDGDDRTSRGIILVTTADNFRHDMLNSYVVESDWVAVTSEEFESPRFQEVLCRRQLAAYCTCLAKKSRNRRCTEIKAPSAYCHCDALSSSTYGIKKVSKFRKVLNTITEFWRKLRLKFKDCSFCIGKKAKPSPNLTHMQIVEAAGRVRALRGNRTARGAGAALRAYALHLAQDKSTTFAQNVDNFIACTLDSKEMCPQRVTSALSDSWEEIGYLMEVIGLLEGGEEVVGTLTHEQIATAEAAVSHSHTIMMRNMRQFMSGMKNYLVKHGEREFEKEIEKERLKLKPNEFLNLDAILEGVMHRLVVRPLRARLYQLLATWHATDIRALHAAIEQAHHITPIQLGIKESTKIPSPAVLAVISKHFLKMQEADSPLDKLECLLAAISVIFNSIRSERALGADDLLPILAWTVARCRLVCAELEAELMAGLLPPALLTGEGGYYLTALFSAVAVLKRLAPSEPSQQSTAPWRRGSLESGSTGAVDGACAVVRVALPDECRGSIRRVALPCRPGARARDLCRALAIAAAITNPQDYALFALYDGHETMLNENDCPQDVLLDKSGQNFILAYKRIDAKIAWPQQALLSLP
ncbi:Protein sprint [Eumeta japonica]|uniref:Protein sprint n=1 Tax=Eumeta variegata TaxID=151549 RepID=A0A4C1UZ90_EUMVA|nr:Protein sprint [Eumeta japonica]